MPGIKGARQLICPKCGHKGTPRREMVRCRNPHCSKCPHGPYYYVFHRISKKLTKCYIGKTWPENPSPNAVNYMIQAGIVESETEAVKLYQEKSFMIIQSKEPG